MLQSRGSCCGMYGMVQLAGGGLFRVSFFSTCTFFRSGDSCVFSELCPAPFSLGSGLCFCCARGGKGLSSPLLLPTHHHYCPLRLLYPPTRPAFSTPDHTRLPLSPSADPPHPSDLMGVLGSRTKAPSTTNLPLWWEIVAAYDGGRQAGGGGGGGGGAGVGGAGRDQGFRRLSVDLQVRVCVYER